MRSDPDSYKECEGDREMGREGECEKWRHGEVETMGEGGINNR